MSDTKLRFAFAIESYYSKESRIDPNYVKFFAEYVRGIGGEIVKEQLSLHQCTEKDYEEFYEPSP